MSLLRIRTGPMRWKPRRRQRIRKVQDARWYGSSDVVMLWWRLVSRVAPRTVAPESSSPSGKGSWASTQIRGKGFSLFKATV